MHFEVQFRLSHERPRRIIVQNKRAIKIAFQNSCFSFISESSQICSPFNLLLRRLYFEYCKAQENFETETNKKLVLKLFRKASIGKVYDSLYGISYNKIPLSNAVEIMAYCLFDGKVEQESEYETNLYKQLVEQLRDMKADF